METKPPVGEGNWKFHLGFDLKAGRGQELGERGDGS